VQKLMDDVFNQIMTKLVKVRNALQSIGLIAQNAAEDLNTLADLTNKLHQEFQNLQAEIRNLKEVKKKDVDNKSG